VERVSCKLKHLGAYLKFIASFVLFEQMAGNEDKKAKLK
jgi:hypothetical protein